MSGDLGRNVMASDSQQDDASRRWQQWAERSDQPDNGEPGGDSTQGPQLPHFVKAGHQDQATEKSSAKHSEIGPKRSAHEMDDGEAMAGIIAPPETRSRPPYETLAQEMGGFHGLIGAGDLKRRRGADHREGSHDQLEITAEGRELEVPSQMHAHRRSRTV